MRLIYNAFYFLIICSLGLSSCGGGDDEDDLNCDANWEEGVVDELTAINEAIAAYIADPNSENCDARNTMYQNYITALKSYENCPLLVGDDLTAFKAALQNAEGELSKSCSFDFDIENVDCTVEWSTFYGDYYENVIVAAAQAYALDQSTANCKEFKSVYLNYINVYLSYYYCLLVSIGLDESDVESAIQESRIEAEEEMSDYCDN